MNDIAEIVALITQLTTLLATLEKLGELTRLHDKHLATTEARIDALPTQC